MIFKKLKKYPFELFVNTKNQTSKFYDFMTKTVIL